MDYKKEKIGGDGHVAIHDWAPVNPDGHHKNSEQIERDIDETRYSMDMILDNLSERFHPRNLIDQFFDVFQKPENKKHVQDMLVSSGKRVNESFQQNPLPLLLIGVGSALLFLNRNKTSQDSGTIQIKSGEEQVHVSGREKVENLKNKAQEQFSTIKENLTGKFDNVKENLKERTDQQREQFQGTKENISERLQGGLERGKGLSGQLRERAHEISERRDVWQNQAADTYRKTSNRLITTMKENPLAAGFAAAMIGAAVGILFPETRAEREIVGEQARETVGKAQEQVKEAVEKGKDVLRESAGVASEKARNEGIAPENLIQKGKEQISEILEKGQNIAKETAGTVKEKSQQKGITPEQFTEKGQGSDISRERPVAKENIEIKKEKIELPESQAAFGSKPESPEFKETLKKKDIKKDSDENLPIP